MDFRRHVLNRLRSVHGATRWTRFAVVSDLLGDSQRRKSSRELQPTGSLNNYMEYALSD